MFKTLKKELQARQSLEWETRKPARDQRPDPDLQRRLQDWMVMGILRQDMKGGDA